MVWKAFVCGLAEFHAEAQGVSRRDTGKQGRNGGNLQFVMRNPQIRNPEARSAVSPARAGARRHGGNAR